MCSSDLAITGLKKLQFKVARRNEKWIGGIVGVVTGMVSATTGEPVSATALAASSALTVAYALLAHVLFEHVLRRARERATLEIV